MPERAVDGRWSVTCDHSNCRLLHIVTLVPPANTYGAMGGSCWLWIGRLSLWLCYLEYSGGWACLSYFTYVSLWKQTEIAHSTSSILIWAAYTFVVCRARVSWY